MKRLAMIAAGLLVLMVGCADGSDGSFVSGSAPNSAQVAGTWDGEGTVTSGTRYPPPTPKITLNFDLSQFENLVVGTFTQDGVDSNRRTGKPARPIGSYPGRRGLAMPADPMISPPTLDAPSRPTSFAGGATS